MKRLVFTSGSDDVQTLLVEWATSLRSLGRYDGEVVVLDYGLGEPVRRFLQQRFAIEFVPCSTAGAIVNARYLDAIRLLEGKYADHVVAHFDADIWFQDEIGSLFALGERAPGVVFAPDQSWYREPYAGRADAHEQARFDQKTQAMGNRYQGTVQGGMQCAKAPALARKYRRFAELLSSGFVSDVYGADQFSLTYLFDPELDRMDGHLYDAVGSDARLERGVWYSTRYGTRPPPRVKGLHCIGVLRDQLDRRFFSLRRADLARSLAAAGVRPPDPIVRLDRWQLHDTQSVWGRLAGVVRTCRAHRGSALAVGGATPVYLFDDVGCTSLVPAGHGHDHYWELVGLPFRRHLAYPDALTLSRRAVDVLADTPIELVDKLCDRFERTFFDLMLSILCALQGLSYGIALPALADVSAPA